MNRLRLSDFEKIATGWPKFGLYGMKILVFKSRQMNQRSNKCQKLTYESLQIQHLIISLKMAPFNVIFR